MDANRLARENVETPVKGSRLVLCVQRLTHNHYSALPSTSTYYMLKKDGGASSTFLMVDQPFKRPNEVRILVQNLATSWTKLALDRR